MLGSLVDVQEWMLGLSTTLQKSGPKQRPFSCSTVCCASSGCSLSACRMFLGNFADVQNWMLDPSTVLQRSVLSTDSHHFAPLRALAAVLQDCSHVLHAVCVEAIGRYAGVDAGAKHSVAAPCSPCRGGG